MKNLLAALAVSFIFMAISPYEAEITTALSKGDIDTLSKYFDDTVEVCILDLEDMLDKAEAKSEIKNFFDKHQPKSFKVIHNGTSKGQDSRYFIGNLNTGEDTFRVYVYLKNSNEAYLIQEIRFEKN